MTTAPAGYDAPPLTPRRLGVLVAFAVATVALIPMEAFGAGAVAWIACAGLTRLERDPRLQRNMGLLLGCIAVLAVAPIHTGLEPIHFATLGIPLLAVVLGPWLVLHRLAPDEARWRFWPRPVHRRDVAYTLVSVPLAWAIIELYFFHLNPELPTHWPLPPTWDAGAVRRLTLGINAVGIFDELFFINTCYVLLRQLFPARVANAAQAVVYTSVLYHMAFTGWGIVIVYLFALTQGVMYEKSRVLLWVLIVHLIVDMFLVLAIVGHAWPGRAPAWF